jgi:hypothetical protein
VSTRTSFAHADLCMRLVRFMKHFYLQPTLQEVDEAHISTCRHLAMTPRQTTQGLDTATPASTLRESSGGRTTWDGRASSWTVPRIGRGRPRVVEGPHPREEGTTAAKPAPSGLLRILASWEPSHPPACRRWITRIETGVAPGIFSR